MPALSALLVKVCCHCHPISHDEMAAMHLITLSDMPFLAHLVKQRAGLLPLLSLRILCKLVAKIAVTLLCL